MNQPVYIEKRDGTLAHFDDTKLLKYITNVTCKDLDGVSASVILDRVKQELYPGIKTTDIDTLILKAMVNLIDETEHSDGNVNYQYAAGRQRATVLYKDVFHQRIGAPIRLFTHVKQMVDAGWYAPELLQWYTEPQWDYMGTMVDYRKDLNHSYAAIEQFVDKYLVKNRVTGEVYEVPQIRYLIIAATIFHDEGDSRMALVKSFYEAASTGKFTLATPVLAGLGTPTKQFSSCVLIKVGDSLDSIFAAGELVAKYASKRAGIGLDVGRIRPLGAPIRGGEIKHTGLVPFIKKLFGDLRCCSQGGTRNASATLHYPIWHLQFSDLIVLKNNQGTEETRVRHMDYSVVMSALFWKRFKQNGDITFFDPNEVPELYNAFYEDIDLFDRLYAQYEKRTDISKRTLPAVDVIKNGLLKERTDTGRIYIVNIDNVQKQGPFDPSTHTIYQSNLCQEILLPTKEFTSNNDSDGRVALCTLGSINWGAFAAPSEMKEVCQLLVRALSNILAYQDYLSVQSKQSTLEIEPLGIGITNLAYWHAKRSLRYGEPAALAEVKTWMEHQAFYLTEASVELAKQRGACKHSHLTRYGQGIFPWHLRAPAVDELTDFTPTMPWDRLRADMLRYGIRNAVLMAIAPTESSSVVLSSTNGIELPMALISVKESKSGNVVQVVPEYHELKDKYQLLWDQHDCDGYLKTVAVLAAYVDQSISSNTFYSPDKFADGKIPATVIAQNLMLAHRWGIKTHYYSLINKRGAKKALEVVPHNIKSSSDADDDCEACKL